jgi:hypothetical protein
MNVWLVTTGSSDVQLSSDENWNDWWQEIKRSLYRLWFEPSRASDDDEEPYRLAARVIGIADEKLTEQVRPYLLFPLLQNFTQELKAKEIPIDQIIVLLSDQEKIFSEVERETKRCPYWQDTCQLYPALKSYLRKQFPSAIIKPLILSPTSSESGLDNWDAVLGLVQQELKGLVFETTPQNIYVSHQAGTPAISSAVQFSSLARFADRVKFLVSNEQDSALTSTIGSSAYLRGIKFKQASKLLDNHDYAGIKNLIGDNLTDDSALLLDAALNWNIAKFDEFLQDVAQYPYFSAEVEERKREDNWWWKAYESAYLAIVRLEKQENIVDALFHSFRAIEGIFTEWGVQNFKDHIQVKNGRPYLKTTILDEDLCFERAKYKEIEGKKNPENDLAKLKDKLELIKLKNKDSIFYGLTIYTLFREVRRDWKSVHKPISRFWDSNNGISEKRNKIFHQLQGLTKDELFEIWEVGNFDEWRGRLRDFSNFVSGQKYEFLDKEDSDGKVASLMVKVHQELKKVIDDH